ncbi:MAG: DnaJ domain-containing protein [Proteobacteria bacterium]|nr:DnaJ domain-containing protein [Pseudomonadota bacterium]
MASPPISIKLRCTSWKQLAAIYERDLRRSSVFLKSAAPPPVGTQVRINLTLPTQTLIILNGTVDRHVGAGELNGRGPGVDIKLNSVPQSAMWIIESALDAARREEAASQQKTGVREPEESASDVELEAGEKYVAAEEELIAALSQELEALRKLNAFQVLGLSYGASDEEIRAAFGQLTKRYHPDRFARYESSEARQMAAEIFIHIRDAYQRLENPDSRAKLIAHLDRRRAAQRSARAVAPQTPPDVAPATRPYSAEPPSVPAASAQPPVAKPQRAPMIAERQPSSSVVPNEPPPLPPPPPAANVPPTPAVESTAEPAERASGSQPAIHYNQAYSLLDSGQHAEALSVFKLATRRNPNDREARIGLELAEGHKALSLRDRLEAAQRFEAVLEMDPNNERAARQLAEMRRQATAERKNLLSRLLKQKE